MRATGALLAAPAWGEANPGRVVAARSSVRPRGRFYEAYYSHLELDLDLSARAGLARYIAELERTACCPAFSAIRSHRVSLLSVLERAADGGRLRR